MWFGELSVLGKVVRGTVRRGNVHLGNCPFGELSFGELSVGELSVVEMPLWNCPSGKRLSGNVRWGIVLEMKYETHTCANKLIFEEYMERLWNKSSQKVNGMAKMSSLIRFGQTKHIVNSFMTSNFSYCPLICMFHSRRLNNCINHIHERILRIIYQGYWSFFT